ncbi:MAG: UDP-N-acetylmuramate dehydrogenase [Chloroflexi bacterium]|nr:UDP-N-acetylmuramate dehydrogenase [Chloroflexota bacterium]
MIELAALAALRETFADRLQEDAPLAGYTSSRIGGPADVLLFARSAEDIIQAVRKCQELGLPYTVLGGGSNVLVSDRGLRGVAIINRARLVRFEVAAEPPTAHAESGTTLNDIAQRAARLGLGGFEWAATVPGSLGGAVYGNAGAFDGDMAGNLRTVELVTASGGLETWPVEAMEYSYRSSILKRTRQPVVVLAATLGFQAGDAVSIRRKMEQFTARRRSAQPPGASMGSMFKNPPGDFAGRLIDAAGLKGKRIGNAGISGMHANFFINHGQTRAADVLALIRLSRQAVARKFGIELELEVELIGEWDENIP